MITKKKGLHLGLLLSMLGIGNVIQAIKVTIKNDTRHTVKFKLGFVRTRDCPLRWPPEQKLAAGHTAKIEMDGRCAVGSLKATVQRSGRPSVKVKPYKGHARSRSKSFVISGSDDEAGYTVLVR